MSQTLVSLNEDLSRLRQDGFDISIAKSKHLIVRDVPAVTPGKEVKKGMIICDLDLAGDRTVPPRSHVAFFVGECPCDIMGVPLPGVSANTNQPLGEGLAPNHQISRKLIDPASGQMRDYRDYHEKISTYADIVWGPARTLRPESTPLTHPVVIPDEGESVFNYLDTAATKAGIVVANKKLEGRRVAIVGLGGTGSYILDLLAKCPIAEIHLFDKDVFLNHNAFRGPGAPSVEDLRAKPQKTQHFNSLYSKMRKGIIPHDTLVEQDNVSALTQMDCVFLCIDKGPARQVIVDYLEATNVAFLDVGIGIELLDAEKVSGTVKITTSTPVARAHVRRRVGFGAGEGPNEYSRNVQIAEISALSAALAVIKWKKLVGYYDDQTLEHFTAYTISFNQLISEDRSVG